MSVKPFTLTAFLVFLLLVSCNNENKNPVQEQKIQEVQVISPDFNADSAFNYVKKQVDFGPRVPNSKAHKACAGYLTTVLKSFTPNVIVQKAQVRAFNNSILNISNIIACFNPDAEYRVLLCAHWDSRPFADHDQDEANIKNAVDGANDGASGVGVILEIARQLKSNDPGIGVDLILFDAEDYGQTENIQPQQEDTWCLGSQYWAKNPHKPNYNASFAILLDMVGAKNATFLKEEYSSYYAPEIVNKVWNTAGRLGYSSFFPDQQGGAVTDDHYYINTIRKIPAIDIIHQDMTGQHSFFEQWHTTYDNMNNIDRLTLKATGQTLLQVIFEAVPKPAA